MVKNSVEDGMYAFGIIGIVLLFGIISGMFLQDYITSESVSQDSFDKRVCVEPVPILDWDNCVAYYDRDCDGIHETPVQSVCHTSSLKPQSDDGDDEE